MMKFTRKGVTELVRTIVWLGFTQQTGRWGMMVVVYLAVTTILVINSILFVMDKWDETNKRLDGFKGIIQYIMFFTYFTGLSFDWKNSMLLMNFIENGLYKWPYRSTVERSELEHHIENDVMRLNTIWYYSLTGYIVMAILAPLTVFTIRLLQTNIADITIDMLYSTIPFYLPKNHETLSVYFVVFSLQSFFVIYGIRSGYVTVVSAFNSMQLIQGELKGLRLMLKELDLTVGNIYEEKSSKNFIRDQKDIYAYVLKAFIIEFIKRHNYIYRKVNDVTKGLQFVAFSINSGLAILICTAIYKITTKTDMIVIVQETIYVSTLIFCIYCYGSMGEKVSTADSNLKNALYEVSWVDKPQWFKKSLQIIMTRTNRTVEIKPFGLFVLNLKNFLLTMRAVYSYYNVLNNLK